MPEARIIRRIKDYPRWDVLVKILLYVPLITINVFNVLYILIHIKEPPQAFLWQYKMVLINALVGPPALLLLVVLGVLLLLFAFKKATFLGVQRFAFFSLILFFISLNITQFPRLNEFTYKPGSKLLSLKKDGTLSEAMAGSVATFTYYIQRYIQMDNLIQAKKLIIPVDGRLRDDYFFFAFIHPSSVEE
ncbi:hypothetical protein ACFLT9_03925, partial [Acidobacteriota bacterium]